MKRWRITLTFGRVALHIIEPAEYEHNAIAQAQRYAAALGYAGHPDRIESRRILA